MNTYLYSLWGFYRRCAPLKEFSTFQLMHHRSACFLLCHHENVSQHSSVVSEVPPQFSALPPAQRVPGMAGDMFREHVASDAPLTS